MVPPEPRYYTRRLRRPSRQPRRASQLRSRWMVHAVPRSATDPHHSVTNGRRPRPAHHAFHNEERTESTQDPRAPDPPGSGPHPGSGARIWRMKSRPRISEIQAPEPASSRPRIPAQPRDLETKRSGPRNLRVPSPRTGRHDVFERACLECLRGGGDTAARQDGARREPRGRRRRASETVWVERVGLTCGFERVGLKTRSDGRELPSPPFSPTAYGRSTNPILTFSSRTKREMIVQAANANTIGARRGAGGVTKPEIDRSGWNV